MLQFIMDRNVLLYVLAAACAFGVVSQLILRQIYERLIKDTRNTGEPSGRFLQQLRQRFQYCTHLNGKVGDMQALIQKSLIEYRFWGMSLHRWKRIGGDCLAVALLCAFAGTVNLVQNGSNAVAGNPYFWMGALAAALVVMAYGISDIGYRETVLEVGVTDYLENGGAVRSYSETEQSGEYEQEYMPVQESAAPIVSVASGRKAKRRARAETAAAQETRAQREKRELKENLSRMRAGVQETAAEQDRGTGRERGGERTEILRQMDPKEQERILREVLKEFLA